MQEIRSFFGFWGENLKFFNCSKDLITKYFMVDFALSFISSFRAQHDYMVDPTQLL